MKKLLIGVLFLGSLSIVSLCTETYAVENAPGITAIQGVAAGGDIRDNEIIINQYSPERLRQMIREEVQGVASEKADKLSRELAVTKQALLGFFKILQQDSVPADKLVETLAAIAHRHKALLERLAVFNPEDPTLKKLIEQARNAVNISDYDRADRLLEKVETAEMEAVRKAEQLAADAQSEANRKRLKVAAVRAARGNISLTKLDYRQAAEHFKEASEIVPASNRLQRNEYLSNYAFALYRQGTERIDGEALQEAILTYREILKDYTRELLPQDWAMTQNNLGNALQEQGLRSGGEAGARLLAKAVTAYCQALEIHTREQLPQDWATTQNNLGNALAELGKLKNDKKLIERAIAAIQSVAGYYQEIGVSRYDAYFGDKLKSLKEMLTE